MHLYKRDGFDLVLQNKNPLTNMPDLWDSTNSVTNRKRASNFHKAAQLIQSLMQTLLKNQDLFNTCLAFFFPFSFFLRVKKCIWNLYSYKMKIK